MRLRLINTYSTDNVGDAAIYQALIDMAESLGIHEVESDLPESQRASLPRLDTDNPSTPADLFLHVGGDIFNNARPQLVTRRFLQLLWRVLRTPAARSVLFGQSIPTSCRGAALSALAMLLRRLPAVYLRDTGSVVRLKNHGVNAQLSWDTVFGAEIPAGTAQTTQSRLRARGLQAENLLLMSLRGFDAMYPHDQARFEDRIITLAKAAMARGLQPAVLIQARAAGADNDAAIANRIITQCPGTALIDPFAEIGIAPWVFAAGCVGSAYGVLAVRYHTAIFRLLGGRVPFHLHYSNKGADLTARLGLPGAALEDFHPDTALDTIEAIASQTFDIDPLRQQVRRDFRTAILSARQGRREVAAV